MLKFKIIWSIVILLGTTLPAWCQINELAKMAARQGAREMRVPSRVKGADVAGHFKLDTPGARWAQTYLLNEKFKKGLAQETQRQLMQYHENNLLLGERPIMHPHSLRARILNPYLGDWNLQRKQLEIADHYYQERVDWLKKQPQEGKEQLGTHWGQDSSHVLAERLQNENLIFVGEYHNVPTIRSAAADFLLELHALEPKRTLVVFAESLYLDPLGTEEAFPYTFSRRGVEGVQDPVNIGRTSTDPAYVHMQNYPSYHELVERLATTPGIEVYPVEDATVVQKLEMQQKVLTLAGLQERNAGFARVMRAQMDHIRQRDPQALFVFYGGNAHTSWAFPTSLPKLFADEFPVVVEMSSPAYVLYSHSILGTTEWAWQSPFYDSTLQTERLFYWKGTPETARLWGRQVGFDYRLVVAE